jgi:hypothetical protein
MSWGILQFKSESWASYRGHNCATKLWQEVKTKEPLRSLMVVTLQEGIIQWTKYASSNHPLFQRSVLDFKLRE